MPVRLLSFAPYRILPATTGGHWGIVSMHHALGKICADKLVGVAGNSNAENLSFELERIYSNKPAHYLPYNHFNELVSIARKHQATHLFCDHPYLWPTVERLSRKFKIPWFLRSHNMESLRFKTLGKWWWPVMHWFEKQAMKKAHGIFFITPEERNWAIDNYGLAAAKCFVAPFGTDLSIPPFGHEATKEHLAQSMNEDAGIPWLYFLGVHSYQPNQVAVRNILDHILPLLEKELPAFRIFIGGKGLSDDLVQRMDASGRVRYLGFVEDLPQFLNACDVMLNPVLTGGGIKTKAVEALAYNKMVVSTRHGAEGLLPAVCDPNLLISGDGNWDEFTGDIMKAIRRTPAITNAFYQHYNWDHIAQQVLADMEATPYA